MSKSIEDMKAQRRELDRKIRSAQRAKKKAAAERLLSARQDLGVWLAEAVGADTPDAVEQVRRQLESGQIPVGLRRQITAGSPDGFEHREVMDGGDRHDRA